VFRRIDDVLGAFERDGVPFDVLLVGYNSQGDGEELLAPLGQPYPLVRRVTSKTCRTTSAYVVSGRYGACTQPVVLQCTVHCSTTSNTWLRTMNTRTSSEGAM
jgi:hypothetical protein